MPTRTAKKDRAYYALIALAIILNSVLLISEYGGGTSGAEEMEPSIRIAPSPSAESTVPAIDLKANFYLAEEFHRTAEMASVMPGLAGSRAIIAPHHLLASPLLHEAFLSLSGKGIARVVVIGPNHDNIGVSPITTSLLDWETPFGRLRVDEDLTGRFLDRFGRTGDQAALENEHSVGAIMPFIRYHLGDVTVMAIVASSYAGYREMDELSDLLSEVIGPDTLIVYSLDFSHYLEKAAADRNDELTKSLIENGEIGRILELDNDHVDSPGILALSLLYARKNGLVATVFDHANSFDYSYQKPSKTTSYFLIGFE